MDPRRVEHANEHCNLGRFEEALAEFQELEAHSSNSLQRAGYLLDEATCYAKIGKFALALSSIDTARRLVGNDLEARAQVDFLAATLLIEDNRAGQGLDVLSGMLSEYADWLSSREAREMYEKIQVQRAFALMHGSKNVEARPLLEEARCFTLKDDVKRRLHCHLARCYHELGDYRLAKEQFLLANELGVPEDWDATFHYYFGYTLYRLEEFNSARREFILCVQSAASGPPRSYAYKMLAATSRKLGEYDQARLYDAEASKGI